MTTGQRSAPAQRRALEAYVKLMRGAGSVQGRLESRLLARGLTESQFGVLEILLHRGPRSPRELKDKLLTTGGNVTMVVDNLEKRGWVERVRDAVDRRRLSVRLTPAGRRVIEGLFPEHARAIVEELSVLTAAEQEELGRLCRKIGRRD